MDFPAAKLHHVLPGQLPVVAPLQVDDSREHRPLAGSREQGVIGEHPFWHVGPVLQLELQVQDVFPVFLAQAVDEVQSFFRQVDLRVLDGLHTDVLNRAQGHFDEGLGVATGQGLYTTVKDVAGQRARSFPVNTFLGSLYHALEVRERQMKIQLG